MILLLKKVMQKFKRIIFIKYYLFLFLSYIMSYMSNINLKIKIEKWMKIIIEKFEYWITILNYYIILILITKNWKEIVNIMIAKNRSFNHDFCNEELINFPKIYCFYKVYVNFFLYVMISNLNPI